MLETPVGATIEFASVATTTPSVRYRTPRAAAWESRSGKRCGASAQLDPGAAVTYMKIDGVLHEFSDIPGCRKIRSPDAPTSRGCRSSSISDRSPKSDARRERGLS